MAARARSRISYAIVPPSVATRRPRRSASVRKRDASASRTLKHLAELVVGNRDATSEARRAGVSSMPLRPMSASPRAID